MFKNVKNFSCPHHTITNTPVTFQNTVTITAGISDFLAMVITTVKTLIVKKSPKKAPKKSSIETMKMLIGANSKKELETKSNENSNVIGKYDFWRRLSCLL